MAKERTYPTEIQAACIVAAAHLVENGHVAINSGIGDPEIPQTKQVAKTAIDLLEEYTLAFTAYTESGKSEIP